MQKKTLEIFQLPINNRATKTQPQADPADYEYLCEDGARRTITDKPCSWAARPWQGYIGNSIVKTCSSRFQSLIKEFYEDGKKSSDKISASKLWINEKNVVVSKDEQVLPGDHLTRAQYKDVIEREGPFEQKIRYNISIFLYNLRYIVTEAHVIIFLFLL